MMLGILPIDEKDSVGAATAFLDMCIKFGTLEEVENGTFAKTKIADLDIKRMHAVGDRATLENCSSFENRLADQGTTTDASYGQSEVFLETFDGTVFWPGDWHTGMNMLQSIHKVYWDNFLGPLRDILRWTRLRKDCRDNYLTKFANREALRYLWHGYVTKHFPTYEAMVSQTEDGHTRTEADVKYDSNG